MALHICSITSFWARLAPQLSHEHEAVRHAIVAVGAAYHLYKVTDTTSVSRSTNERLVAFLLQQYNKSISILQQDIRQQRYVQDPTIVLICCLAYIYLESLRFNHSAAIRHLKNGIRIIESSVDVEDLHNCVSVVRQGRERNAVLSDPDLWDIILQFRNYELCMHCFTPEVPMMLGTKLYGKPLVNTTAIHLKPFANIAEGHEARLQLASEVMSRDWKWRDYKRQPAFWAEKHIQQELSWLLQRGQCIRLSLQTYLSSSAAPKKGTWEYYSICMDMLHISCILGVIQLMPMPPEEHATIAHSSDFQNDVISNVIAYGEEMHAVHTSLGWLPPDISLETSIVGPMYWVYVYSVHERDKKRAMRILEETKQVEGPWDAKQTLAMLVADSMSSPGTNTHDRNSGQTLRKWGGDAFCHERAG